MFDSLRLIEGLPSSPRFWTRQKEQLFWIELDLQPDDLGIEDLDAHDPACILFFGHNPLSLPQNPRGFIGRGFCITRIGESRKINSLSQETHEEQSAWPVLCNCAFSFGVSTPLSSREFRSSPVVKMDLHTSQPNEDTYLIHTDVASWPDVKPARRAKFELTRFNRYHDLVFRSFGLLLIPTLAAVILLSVKPKLFKTRVGHILILLWLALFGTLLLISFGLTRLRALQHKRAFRRWVQSFAMKDRVD